MSNQRPRVVIIGGGFAGLTLALKLKRTEVDITLIDRRNFHLFQPLLYQVATGGLSPANIAAPLRNVLRNCQNAHVMLGEVVDIDVAGRRVILADGDSIPYDTLVVATGVRHQYFNHPEWEALAPGLKSIEDAVEIRRRVLLAFEKAEFETDPNERQALMTFVIIGAGPTGVELAGTLGELSHMTLRRDFRNITTSDSHIYLLEGADRVLLSFPPALSAKAEAALAALGVIVRCNTMVTDVQPDRVVCKTGDKIEEIATRTVLWGAGVIASPLGKIVARACGIETDRPGRVPVGPDLSIAGHPEILVIGDLALCLGADGKPLPGVAPVAMQHGKYGAKLIQARLRGDTMPPFQYTDKGSLAAIGRGRAVADLGFLKLSGFLAWLAWLFIHILFIVTFQNRLLILMQWGWNYVTKGRSARIITFPFSTHSSDAKLAASPANPGDGEKK
jgi:NADH dehydrogenase